MNPLVLTLTIDDAAQAHFDALRQACFPGDRLVVGAHVTLFHALPGGTAATVIAMLEQAAAGESPFPVTVARVRFLGRGVAYDLSSARLMTLRDRLRDAWSPVLTKQDAQKFQPHVTVQNKVDPADARALFGRLSTGFAPWEITATGLALWEYLGGPWRAAGRFPFPSHP